LEFGFLSLSDFIPLKYSYLVNRGEAVTARGKSRV
jgi:hypothetical protein